MVVAVTPGVGPPVFEPPPVFDPPPVFAEGTAGWFEDVVEDEALLEEQAVRVTASTHSDPITTVRSR
jgi:hypothetical protein